MSSAKVPFVIKYTILETKGWGRFVDGTIQELLSSLCECSPWVEKFEVKLSKLAVGLQIANRFKNSANLCKLLATSTRSPPLCFQSGRLIFAWGIVPMTSISDNRRGARLLRAVAGRAVLKWKFCQLQSELQEGTAAPSDDLRSRSLQRWRVRQSGTAGVFFTNYHAAVILIRPKILKDQSGNRANEKFRNKKKSGAQMMGIIKKKSFKFG